MAAKDIVSVDLSYQSRTKEGISESSMKLALDQIRKLEDAEVVSFVFTGTVMVDGELRCLQAIVGNYDEVSDCMHSMIEKYNSIENMHNGEEDEDE